MLHLPTGPDYSTFILHPFCSIILSGGYLQMTQGKGPGLLCGLCGVLLAG